jgi:hypothetical protein
MNHPINTMSYSAAAVLGHPQKRILEQLTDTRNRNTANLLGHGSSPIPVSHYGGRFFWSGPAARVADIPGLLSCTKVKCLWDESAVAL